MNRTTFYLLLLLLMVAWSCEKEGDLSISSPQPKFSTVKGASSSSIQQAVPSPLTKDQAIAVINASYKNYYNPIKVENVKGLNRQQFIEWLRKTKIASAESYLNSLLTNNGVQPTEFALLNVTSRATGKLSTIGIIGVPPDEKYDNYGDAVTLITQSDILVIVPVKLCIYKSCSSDGKCIKWIKLIRTDATCPANECNRRNRCDSEIIGTWGINAMYRAVAAF